MPRKVKVIEPEIKPEPVTPIYTCGVVVHKGETMDDYRLCNKDAVDVIQEADPADPTHTRIRNIILLCAEHSDRMSLGETFLLHSTEGNFVSIQLNVRPEDDILM